MATLCAMYFFVQASSSIIQPYLQIMLRNSGFIYAQIGVLLALFECAGIIGPIVTGSLVDKTGRLKIVMLLCTVIMVVAFFAIDYLPGTFIILLAIGVGGFTYKSLLSLLDVSTMRQVEGDTYRYSRVRIYGTVGYILFGLLWTALKRPYVDDNHDIFMFIFIGAILFFVPLLIAKRDEIRPKQKKMKGVPNPRKKWCNSVFYFGLVIMALSRLGLSASGYLSLYMVDKLQNDQITLMNSLAATTEIFGMVLSGYLMSKKDVAPVTMLMISALATVVRLLLYALVPSMTGVILGQCTQCLSYGFYMPATIMFVAKWVSKSHQAAGVSLCQSFGSGLPTMIGDMVGGIVIQHFGYRTFFLLFCIPAAIAALLVIIFFKRFQQPRFEET
ncbi:MAG: MFS transporter [Spirochaetia bacterium]|nr:MFS transporter [Spirochaetia bacterium]